MDLWQVSIRAATYADARAIAEVHIRSWQETYAGLLPPAMLEALSVEDRTARWEQVLTQSHDQGSTSIFVGERDGAVHGFISCGKQRDASQIEQGFSGEIYAIYVLQDGQGQGIGSSLMAAAARALAEHGHQSASLWVLRDNASAQRFYERRGGEIVGQKEEHRETGTLVELAYGWRELDSLLS